MSKIIIRIGNIIFLVVIFVFILLSVLEYKNVMDSTNLGWKKYSNHQVLGDGKTGTLFDPNVIVDNGKYMMYVSSRENDSISLSLSKDGYTWSSPVVVFSPNENSTWDKVINRCSVIKKDGKYYMYYTGQADEISRIGVAVSDDGLHFIKLIDDAIISPEYSYEGTNTMNPYVMFDEDEKNI